ncbi:superinfection immunity protein [Peptostreptococcaceae bacterium OttesenSCG-928-C18]|nr:superinfection immunity protein [Peptostreptococcaceae bacterium OttesenSCG-928-C18]
MRCKYCGEEINDEYLYCLFCGKPSIKSKEEHILEQERVKKQETAAIEYFEIENETEEKKEEYDFSKFLYDNEEIEVDYSKETKKSQEDYDLENTINNEFEIEDDFDETKERKFGRSDFKIYDEFRKNKQNNPNKQKEKKKKDNVNARKEKVVKNENIESQFISEEDKKIQKLKRKSRFWKRFRNFFYNIIAVVGIWLLYVLFVDAVVKLLAENVVGEVVYSNIQLVKIAILLIILFLFIPFFICKGNAKIPLFLMCILISWTLVGWIILMVVAIRSNIKFNKLY